MKLDYWNGAIPSKFSKSEIPKWEIPKGKFPNIELQVIKEYNTNIRFDSFKLQ